MKKIIYLILILCSFSCSKSSKKQKTDNFSAWNKLVEVVSKKDKKAFKNLCDKTLNCYLCDDYNSEPMPIDNFINNKFDKVFTDDFINYLKKAEIKTHIHEVEKETYCELLIKPQSTFSEEILNHFFEFNEKSVYHFRFKKVNNQWKLFDIGTIP